PREYQNVSIRYIIDRSLLLSSGLTAILLELSLVKTIICAIVSIVNGNFCINITDNDGIAIRL
ncbi:MAG: hypothetical protein Q4C83_02835, partial [Candidatus Saccharibacteria bacterium]|nr:hypothetical protein [Candidatus Saccharibacteria bacterium]